MNHLAKKMAGLFPFHEIESAKIQVGAHAAIACFFNKDAGFAVFRLIEVIATAT
jgi:hypothetical protein